MIGDPASVCVIWCDIASHVAQKKGSKEKNRKKLRKLAHPDVSHEPGDRSRMAVHGPPETCLQQVSARDGDASVVRHPCRVNAGSTRKYVSLSGSAMRPSSNTSNLTALSESVDLKNLKIVECEGVTVFVGLRALEQPCQNVFWRIDRRLQVSWSYGKISKNC